MLTGASDLAVVRLMVDLCAGLEIRLTAEGVERCAQVEVAARAGCAGHPGPPRRPSDALDQLQPCSGADSARAATAASTALARSLPARSLPTRPRSAAQPRAQRAAVPSE